MEYYQNLNNYFASQGCSPKAAAYYSMAAYMQAQKQALQTNPQTMTQQFLALNDGQKMQFVQKWLLQNPQYFKKS